jgi:hypothetical protein
MTLMKKFLPGMLFATTLFLANFAVSQELQGAVAYGHKKSESSSSSSPSSSSSSSDKHCKECPRGPRGYPGPQGPQGQQGSQGQQGATGGVLAAADFFALMPGDNAATVGAGTPVQFPQNGPVVGSGITRVNASEFNLAAVGTYQILFQVSVTEPGQLVVALDSGSGFQEQAYTVVGRATGTSQIVGMCLVTTTVANTLISIQNPLGNSPALTITPSAGGTHSVSAHLVITRIQ